jgi:hypothetical protein
LLLQERRDAVKYCNVRSRNSGYPCNKAAKYYVTYFGDGSGGVETCGRHLAKAVDDVRSVSTVPANGIIKLLPLGEKP